MGNGAAAGSDRAAMKVCKPYFGGGQKRFWCNVGCSRVICVASKMAPNRRLRFE